MAEMQAKVAQEMAIAQRIKSAEEVEIEEYHEGTGERTAGVKADAAALTLGIGGKGSRVTRRIYLFQGHTGNLIEAKASDELAQQNSEPERK